MAVKLHLLIEGGGLRRDDADHLQWKRNYLPQSENQDQEPAQAQRGSFDTDFARAHHGKSPYKRDGVDSNLSKRDRPGFDGAEGQGREDDQAIQSNLDDTVGHEGALQSDNCPG